MDPKTRNELVHDREAAFHDERFLIDYSPARIARDVRRPLTTLLGAPPRAARALDVACGTGFGAIGLAAGGMATDCHACDLSSEMVARARANAVRANTDVRFARCDAERLPYADACFDLVLVRGALHHLPEPLAALTEMRRVLAPGGTVVVLAEPTPGSERQVGRMLGAAARAVEALRPLRRAPNDPDRVCELASIAANRHTFEPEDIATLAEKAGFEDITVGTASWAWILALELNHYLLRGLPVARNAAVKRLARALTDAAAVFDRAVADRALPSRWRHTVQAVLR
jgi:ubiquinone/menaquinone biosynthesis C-methylase UbiE